MPFVVAPIMQLHDPDTNTSNRCYPVVFEDVENGYSTSPVDYQPDRAAADAVAADLNAALDKHAAPPAKG